MLSYGADSSLWTESVMPPRKSLKRKSLNIHRFDLDSRGLTCVLGDFEARKMEAVWGLSTPTINDIMDTLDPVPHYKTVLTVANRLLQKAQEIGRTSRMGANPRRVTTYHDGHHGRSTVQSSI